MEVKVQARETLKPRSSSYGANCMGVRRLQRSTLGVDQKVACCSAFR